MQTYAGGESGKVEGCKVNKRSSASEAVDTGLKLKKSKKEMGLDEWNNRKVMTLCGDVHVCHSLL